MAKTGTILIVDDELVIRSLLSEMLSEDGFSVATAEDGKRGLEYLNREGQVDLVISDIHMPVMSGPELIRELRKTNPDLPVIVLNSIPDRDVSVSGGGRVTECVNKPFDLQALRDAIQRLQDVVTEAENLPTAPQQTSDSMPAGTRLNRSPSKRK